MAFLAGAIKTSTQVDMKGFNNGLTKMKKGAKVAGAAIAAAFVSVMAVATKKADEFEKSMSNVSTIVDETQVNIQKLASDVLKLDPALGNAKQMTDALYQSFSAGASDAKEAMDITVDSARFAGAVLTDTATAVDVLTTAVNAYGKEVMSTEKASDIFFTTVKDGKITGEQLASTIGQSIPLFASTGIALEELAAGMAAMTKQGVNASNATTQLNAIVNAFLKPSGDMTKALQEMGYESGSAFLKAEGLAGALKMLEERTGGDATALSNLLPNIRALRGAMALTGVGGQEFAKVMGDMATAAGSTETAFAKQEKTFKTFKNQLDNLLIVVGRVSKGFVDKMVKGLTKTVAKIQEFLTSAKGMTFIENLTNAITGAFKTLGEIMEPIGKAVMDVIEWFSKLDASEMKLIIGMGLAAASIGPMITAVKALHVALLTLAANPLVGVLIGLAAVTVAVIAATKEERAYNALLKETAKNMSTVDRQGAELATELAVLRNKTFLTNEEQERQIEIVNTLKDIYPDLTEATLNDAVAMATARIEQEKLNKAQLAGNLADLIELREKYLKTAGDETQALKVLGQQYLNMNKIANASADVTAGLAIDKANYLKTLEGFTAEEFLEEAKRVGVSEQRLGLKALYANEKVKELDATIKATQASMAMSAAVIGVNTVKLAQLEDQADDTGDALDGIPPKPEDGKDPITGTDWDEFKALLAERLEIVQDERNAELAYAAWIITENERLAEAADKKEKDRLDKRRDTIVQHFNEIMKITKMASDIIFGLRDNQIQKEINAANKAAERDLEILQGHYDDGLLSKEEYEERKANVEKDANSEMNKLLKAQFENQKKAQMASAVMDAGSSIMGWWANAPALGAIAGPIFAGAMTALTLGALGVQLDAISNQTFTPRRTGGKASGLTRMHEDGGELTFLPDGSVVIPSDLSSEMVGGGHNIYNYFDGAQISNDYDLEYVANYVSEKMAKKLRLAK